MRRLGDRWTFQGRAFSIVAQDYELLGNNSVKDFSTFGNAPRNILARLKDFRSLQQNMAGADGRQRNP